MIRAFVHRDGSLVETDAGAGLDAAVWIDLSDPAPEEVERVRRDLGMPLPEREVIEEIETSSRLYHEGDTSLMTAVLPGGTGEDGPRFRPVTFALAPGRLVTLRFHDPKPFRTYPTRAAQVPVGCASPEGVLLGLLYDVVDRLADLLERVGQDLDAISDRVFAASDDREGATRDHRDALKTLGRLGDFVARFRNALLSVERLLGFLAQTLRQREMDADARALVKTLSRDVAALTTHTDFLGQKITLLLDATLGFITIEQAGITKIFSVVAFVMLPPTLIASIYGMNIEYMPELDWPYAYPAVLAAMVVSAVVPYLYFKWKGWL
ncbi:MAG: magnesium transporter CorA family protein [Paracoccaceae bacterium]